MKHQMMDLARGVMCGFLGASGSTPCAVPVLSQHGGQRDGGQAAAGLGKELAGDWRRSNDASVCLT